MEVLGRVEPEVDPLLPVALPSGEHIGLEDVGLATPVPQELKVDLVVLRVLRRELSGKNPKHKSVMSCTYLLESFIRKEEEEEEEKSLT